MKSLIPTKITLNNRLMYEWSSKRKDTILITGHTHQPVFRSLTELEILYESLASATGEKQAAIQARIDKLHLQNFRPPAFNGYLDTYFNSGCCCFDDGDITGIEIADNCIRLIKWEYKGRESVRIVLEESQLKDLRL
ncbi:hypothetical protein HK413_13165 [Mucilaginibacter sp. S1162]|uniref:Uncharacterized protein n=1 Tax=Mucilaginibacter humi TaxID=2732510 RepID=A0ABX1W4K4_9SPHI|nr:hypothetical protein [Mucilaginibacter humi]NNU34769.1 hypothetical protein [Mucilaginibacter humi]